jgi:coenzyme PQQ biosynthesis protein PqqD
MLLYAPGRETAFSLNAAAKAIWELCDGRHSLAAICQELGRRFDCPAATLQADVQNAVARLEELGLLEWDEPLPPTPNG